MSQATTTLAGWGNCPREDCLLRASHSEAQLAQQVQHTAQQEQTCIARGLGRAYGDSALNAQQPVLLQTPRNRLLAFDSDSGQLTCEAGVSFAEIIDVFLPRGWFLPTTPGTKFVTVGGAIAADVHGKNHHRDGSFGAFVDEIALMLADGSTVTCSRNHRPDLFWATVGGMGLTGVILTATFRLNRVETAYYNVDYSKTHSLDESLERFAATNHDYRYSVAWIDCLASGARLGRSVLMLGNDAARSDLKGPIGKPPLRLKPPRRSRVPVNMPDFVLSPTTVRAFNELFYFKHPTGRKLVDFDRYFYPLDSVLHWNRIYGKRGFVQYQLLLPPHTARGGLVQILEKLAKAQAASFLAVLKSCGPQNEGMLSYLHEGYTLALDLPNTGEPLRKLLRQLDEITLQHEGRLYLAKDATMDAATFQAMYPRLNEFRRVKAEVDPEHRFSSSQARRVGLVPA